MTSTRNRVRAALLSAGGAPAAGMPATHAGPPIQQPFASAEPIEHETLRAIAIGPVEAPPAGMGFLDGIQRHWVDGHFGLNPVVRGYVAAGVLVRRDRELQAAARHAEEFLVVPDARLTTHERAMLAGLDLPVYDSDAGSRPHPLMDVQAAAVVIERRREDVERRVALEFIAAAADAWLVVDGAITGLPLPQGFLRAIGVVKSHETQYLDGDDLAVALHLPAGHRTSVFQRTTESGRRAFTWYLRLWPADAQGLLHGLVRLERPADDAVLAETDQVSRWMLAERAPIAAPDSRWDRLLYPVKKVEDYLRAQAGGWR